MGTAREDEKNNTPKTASGNHLLSEYKNGQSRFSFDATVQSTGREYDPLSPYDPVDYFGFKHLEGLKKVNWNMSFLMNNLWNFEKAGGFGGVYNLNITPEGAFHGKSVSVTIKTGFANYVDEWYGYNEAWRQTEALLEMRRDALMSAGKDTTTVEKSLEVMDDLQTLLAAIPGSDKAELHQIESELKEILKISAQTLDDAASVRGLAKEFRSMAAGWDELHYYLGNSDKEVFLKEMSARTTWKVKGDGPGYVAFSGGVTIYNSFYDFDFREAKIPMNWYLEVQSESKPKRGKAVGEASTADVHEHARSAHHASDEPGHGGHADPVHIHQPADDFLF